MKYIKQMDITLEKREDVAISNWTILFDIRMYTMEEITEWIEEQTVLALGYDSLISRLCSKKGVVFMPTENALLLKEWIHNTTNHAEIYAKRVE